MKIRMDFVTNSSSSNFTLGINFELADGSCLCFPPKGRLHSYFTWGAYADVSPRQLGTAESVDELIALLTDGVRDGEAWQCEEELFNEWYVHEDEDGDSWCDMVPPGTKIFQAVCDKFGHKGTGCKFIKEIQSQIKSMDDIVRVTVTGNEENYRDYLQTYTYDRQTKAYTGVVEGSEFECDGESGGGLYIPDSEECEIIYKGNSWFCVEIEFMRTNGGAVTFCGWGGKKRGYRDCFEHQAVVTVSPKQLAKAKNITELIEMLAAGVLDEDIDSGNAVKIFERQKSPSVTCRRAYEFIRELRSKIKSMKALQSITITGQELNFAYDSPSCRNNEREYTRAYTYDLVNQRYTGTITGQPIQKIGWDGGDLRFTDLDECKITKQA